MRLLLATVLVGLAVAGCGQIQPKDFTSDDDCRDCAPGLLTGPDGVARWEWGRQPEADAD